MLDLRDRDPIEPGCTEAGKDVLVEALSQIVSVGRTSLQFALVPAFGDLGEPGNPGRVDILAAGSPVEGVSQSALGFLAGLVARAAPGPVQPQGPIVEFPSALAIAAAAARDVELLDLCHRRFYGPT